MQNQMFSSENFRDIFDEENRKGHNVADKFFPDLKPLTTALLECRQTVRNLYRSRASLPAAFFEISLREAWRNLDAAREKRLKAIELAIDGVSARIRNSSFKLELKKTDRQDGKDTYQLDQSPESFFVGKQLQKNLSRIYKVKPSSRNSVVAQVLSTLSTRFPLEVVRTDISRFYESVDRKALLRRLDADPLLSATSKRFLHQILSSYAGLSGSSKGIPRGVGVSAYLAEMYVSHLDAKVRALNGIVLYCRYVDDMVAVFAKSPVGGGSHSSMQQVERIIENDGLNINREKTKAFAITPSRPARLSYLGYRIAIHNGKCRVRPSIAKLTKYRKRMELSFKAYHELAPVNARRAFRDLVARVRFLTGNTRLLNSKQSAASGIYYNNTFVNEDGAFDRLDRLLREKIEILESASLKARLSKLTFSSGFSTRRFHRFSTVQMHSIVRVWKNA